MLLVDDDPWVREGLHRTLMGAEFEVETVGTGEEALARLASGHVDVIISDERMPGMCGTELLARVRTASPETVRIMLTGSQALDSAVRAINDGAVFRFLCKPCGQRELREAVEAALQQIPPASRRRGENVERFDKALTTTWVAAQPIVDLESSSVFAYELLVRTEGDYPHAGAYIDAAVELGRMSELEARILDLVPPVIEAGPKDVAFFVNLHPDSLRMPHLVAPLLPYSGRIVLEITERASLGEAARYASHLRDLRKLGFKIAIDDLGAGYAGLTSVADVRPDVVKLDMALTQGIECRPTHRTLVRSLVRACRELGIAVVAEGVETTSTRDALRELGCSLQQGYLFARPARPFVPVQF